MRPPVRTRFVAEGLVHPLLDAKTRVANDVDLPEPGRALLVTGSNMSGKSTLLRAMGTSVVLARAGAPVCARRLEHGLLSVQTSLRVADSLSADGIEASVLDLRWISPLDRAAVLTLARHTGRVLIVHEDSKTGGIGESLAAVIQEEAFEWLDAPVRIVAALDTPVPYSPPLEEVFLPAEAEIRTAALAVARY